MDTPEVRGLRLDGVLEREVGDAAVPAVRAAGAEFLGTTFVGAGLLRQHGGRQRRADSPLRALAGEEGA